MTTLDDLARVERGLRDQAAINARFEDDFQAHCKTQWADTIAAFIAAQRERDADNAKLRAACAAKDAALAAAIMCDGGTTHDGHDDEVGSRSCCYEISYKPHAADCWVLQAKAALSTDAGRNYVDASGAVESEVITAALANGTRVNARVPDSWAGKPVLIVPKPEGWK